MGNVYEKSGKGKDFYRKDKQLSNPGKYPQLSRKLGIDCKGSIRIKNGHHDIGARIELWIWFLKGPRFESHLEDLLLSSGLERLVNFQEILGLVIKTFFPCHLLWRNFVCNLRRKRFTAHGPGSIAFA